jgi:hypothetical protein
VQIQSKQCARSRDAGDPVSPCNIKQTAAVRIPRGKVNNSSLSLCRCAHMHTGHTQGRALPARWRRPSYFHSGECTRCPAAPETFERAPCKHLCAPRVLFKVNVKHSFIWFADLKARCYRPQPPLFFSLSHRGHRTPLHSVRAGKNAPTPDPYAISTGEHHNCSFTVSATEFPCFPGCHVQYCSGKLQDLSESNDKSQNHMASASILHYCKM